MYDQNVAESVDDCRFISPDILPSLQTISSNAVVLSILIPVASRNHMNVCHRWDESRIVAVYTNFEEKLLKKCGRIIECLRKPKPIEDILKEDLKKTCEELCECIMYFRFTLFRGSYQYQMVTREIRYFDPRLCAWNSNGTVNFFKTAANLIPKLSTGSPKWDMVQRFVVMCNLCMENELEKFDLNSLPKVFLEKVNFDICLVYYWIRRLTNNLHEIPLGNFHSIDARMIVKCEETDMLWMSYKPSSTRRRCYAFRYFWNRLGTEDQISIARYFLRADKHSCFILREMLSMMTWYQQSCLLSEVPDVIILTFCWNDHRSPCTDGAVWAWTQAKNVITMEQFENVIERMLKTRRFNEEVMQVLIEIWDSASSQLKNYFVENTKHQIIQFFLPSADPWKASSPCLSAFKFLHKFLSATDANFRKEIIRKEVLLDDVPAFARFRKDPRMFSELLDLCLPNSNDQLEFKALVVNSAEMKSTNESLFKFYQFDDLKNRLEYYMPNSKASHECVKLLLLECSSSMKNEFIHDERAWIGLSSFIDSMHSYDESLALELKKTFIVSLITDRDYEHFREEHYGEQEWKNMMNVLDSIFVGQDSTEFKQMFLQNLARLYVDGTWRNKSFDCLSQFLKFYEYNFIKCVSWCLGNDENAIREFKQLRLPITSVSDLIFRLIAVDFDNNVKQDSLVKVDECLKWYMTDDQVKKYKHGKISILDGLTIFKRKSHRIIRCSKEPALKKILMWFFNDETTVNEFFKSKKFKVSE